MTMRTHLMAVTLGGAIGAGLRIATVAATATVLPKWIAIMALNIVGSVAIGWCMHAVSPQRHTLRLFLSTGLLGALTTFSGFADALVNQGSHHHIATAMMNITASMCFTILGVVVGRRCAQLKGTRQTAKSPSADRQP